MIKLLKMKDLEPGMVVAKDVYTPFDELIVAKLTELTKRGITRLESYRLREIPILIEDDVQETTEENEVEYKTASEKIKQSESFKQFYNSFQESVKVSEKVMDDIAFRAADVNSKLIDSIIDKVANVGDNGIFIFDMLHCMREMDDFTYAHSLGVALICKVFGEWLHFPKEDIDALKMAGFFHDIGKVKIPREIICKKDKLTTTEYEVVKKHSEFGYDILRTKKIDERIIMSALMHHEKCDGSGYPNRLKREQIDDFAKIVAIADAYEAMTADRCYRKAFCPFAVIEEVEKNALKYYEPKYIIPLMEMIVQSYIGNNVVLNNGTVGEVILLNKNNLSRPIIKTDKEYIDLSKDTTLKIVTVI